ncbi:MULTISPECIES: BrxA/BrxB family bacilliredoxin [Planococcaceae]|uniref:BrxA/BrxB family bacilliredoxin n=1 Tax=Planococcus halotolerans TaxID=2233542 RepID=A0A365KVD8_9BACL|nr:MULTISPECIES: BrxA/BrxB family bacilliredoxin [Planococcaceae]QHJ71431.1 BrxA/BrxB family bacilliredoxin [Planococcus halotolerans]RAZ76715.1 BrxA/BrxB family bacilliredoxin [Planococcus halotolerans]RLQ92160.1 BrxA/BrxB family bacilliredoxin [Planomicrobium sp. Y74]
MSMDFNFLMNDIATQARKELTDGGYKELTTPEDVNEALTQPGTSLVMINSVCGCAGGIARPAALHAVHYDKRPDNLYTVFAGQDKEATAQARAIFGDDHLPSSPSFAIVKDGKMVDEIGRHEIEGHDPMSVITHIQALFEEHCNEI